jgi:acyl-ACP thioesterase
MSQKFEKSYQVHVYETAPNARLSPYSLLNYLQDIASDHAEMLGFGRDDLMKQNSFWVLSRLYVEFISWPEWNEKISLRTWPNGIDKIFALRNFEISYTDGNILGYATSSWLILDRTTRKIQRPEVLLEGLFVPEQEKFAIRNASKLDTLVEQGQTNLCFRIKTSDLDINFHTNNAVYLRWILDSYDPGFLMKNDPESIEINYLAESKYDEEILIRTTAENDQCFNHSIIRKEDDKELCRVRMVWRPLINKKSKVI